MGSEDRLPSSDDVGVIAITVAVLALVAASIGLTILTMLLLGREPATTTRKVVLLHGLEHSIGALKKCLEV